MHMNRKVLARFNGEAFTSEELKNVNTGEGRTTLSVTDEKLIAAFKNYSHILIYVYTYSDSFLISPFMICSYPLSFLLLKLLLLPYC